MTTTTYYDLNIVEGTDVVNPLIVDNPNYQKIDEVMHGNAVSGVTLATEIANATVHAITRENSECAVIRFIATSEWKAGDTVTVDGVPVTALLPSGETLPNGAYVINANVLCILTGTNLTIYAERKKAEDLTVKFITGESGEVTANANGYAYITVNLSIPEGYTAAAIKSFDTGNTNITVEAISINNGEVRARVHNNMASERVANLSVTVMAIKSSIIS